jgi:hypothetical protein
MRVWKADNVRGATRPVSPCPECADPASEYFAGTLYCERHALYHLIVALQALAAPEEDPETTSSAHPLLLVEG